MPRPIDRFLDQSEKKLEGFAQKVVARTESANVEAHLGIMELEKLWHAAQTNLLRQVAEVKRAATNARGKIDQSLVQAHLAKSDAKDSLADLRRRIDRIETQLNLLKSKVQIETHAALDRVGNVCHQLARELDA